MKYKYDIFISYKSEDALFAREVYESLSKEFTIFFSEKTLHDMGSDYFENDIKSALNATLILLNIGTSKEYLSGEWLKKEREYFLPLRDTDTKRRVFNIVDSNFDIKNMLPLDLIDFNTRLFPTQEEELINLLKNVTKNSYRSNWDFLHSNKPKNLTLYENNIFRKSSFTTLCDHLLNIQNQVRLVYVYGVGGVGKSSFMTKSILSFDDSYEKYIYYVQGSDDIHEHLENISTALIKKFNETSNRNMLDLDFDEFNNLQKPAEKIEKVFYSYSKDIYQQKNIKFVLFIDGVDTLKDEGRFIQDIVHDYEGIDIVFSGRVPPTKEFFIKLKEETTSLSVYEQEGVFGLKLENLDQTLTLRYLNDNLKNSDTLTKNEQKTIKSSILEKTKGLPKYFELLLNKLNRIIDTCTDEHELYDRLTTEIEHAPNELVDYYEQIFKSIEKSNPLSMQILQNLYWLSFIEIEKEELISILGLKEKESFYEALQAIEHLVNYKDSQHIVINHLSINEALFRYFAKDIHRNINARQLNKGYMQQVFEKTPIVFYMAKHSENTYSTFSSIYYFSENNVLFQALKNLVNYYINSDKISDENPIELYFIYNKIVFAQQMLTSSVLETNPPSIEHLFTKKEGGMSFKKDKINEKIFRKYTTHKFKDVYKLYKLVAITLYAENSYYQVRYINKYLQAKYIEKYKHILDQGVLTKNSMDILDTALTRTYIAMRYRLEEKEIDAKLGIYDDGGLVMVYHQSKSENIYKKVLDTIQKAQQNKKYRNFIVRQERYYTIIKSSVDVGLKKYFYNFTYKDIKRNDRMNLPLKKFLNQIAKDIVLSDISSLDIHSSFYKYLPTQEQQEIKIIYSLYNSYKEHGLSSILNKKNSKYFEWVATFLEKKDVTEFLEYNNQNFVQKFGTIILNILRNNQDKEVLLLCKNYHNSSMINSFIAYKLDDLEALKKLEKKIIDQEYSREHKKLFSRVVSSIDKDLYYYWDILTLQNMVGSKALLRRYLQKSMYEVEELHFFHYEIVNNATTYVDILVNSSFTIHDIEKLKYILSFLSKENLLQESQKRVFYLNILSLSNVEQFIKSIELLAYDEKLDFLMKLLNRGRKKILFQEEKFIRYILEFIALNSINDKSIKLLNKLVHQKTFFNFAENNQTFFREIYKKVGNKNNLEVEVQSMLYVGLLAIEKEQAYQNLHQQNWISSDRKSRIASTLILANKSSDLSSFFNKSLFSIEDKSMSEIIVLIHCGVVFQDMKKLDNGIKKLMQLSKLKGGGRIEKYEGYIDSSRLKGILSEEVSQLILDLFSSFDSNYYLGKFIDIENFLLLDKLDKNLINNIEKFAFFDILHNVEIEKRLELDDIKHVLFDNDFDKYIMVLYDFYKHAEVEDDEDSYTYYGELFQELKLEYGDCFQDRFDDVSSITLDNYYDVDMKKNFSLDSIADDYASFYHHLQNLVQNEDNKEFEQIVITIKEQPSYFDIVVKNSSIQSKLQMKSSNIKLFEPIE